MATTTAVSGQDVAELYLRLLAESELRRATGGAREPSGGTTGGPKARWADLAVLTGRLGTWAGRGMSGSSQRHALSRLRVAAGTLVSVGALDEVVAESVATDVEAALAARGLIPAQRLLHQSHLRPGRTPGDAGGKVAGRGAVGLVRVLPMGATLPLDDGMSQGELHLMAMVGIGSRILFAVTVDGTRVGGTSRSLPVQHMPIQGLDAVDEHGVTRLLGFSGSGDDRSWEGVLELIGAPDVGPAWLDIGPGAGGRRTRVDLSARASPGLAAVESLLPTTEGERLLESVAEGLLGDSQMSKRSAGAMLANLDVMLAALRAVDALPADSPVPARLCKLASFLGSDVTPAPADDGHDAELPESWTSVLVELGRRGQREGPERVMPVAVVLPEVEGATFVVCGLRSSAAELRIHVCALGWAPGQITPFFHLMAGDLAFSWWVREPNGRWHLGAVDGCGISEDRADFRLRFVPPLDGRSKWIELVVTGRQSRVRAKVPLSWGPSR